MAYLPKAVIYQGTGRAIKTVHSHVCQIAAVALCKELRKCILHSVYSYLCWTKVIRWRCIFPESKGTRERVSFRCFLLLLQKNVKCVLCKTLLARAKRTGWRMQWEQRLSCWEKQAVICTETLSVESSTQACRLQLNKMNSELIIVLNILFYQEINPSCSWCCFMRVTRLFLLDASPQWCLFWAAAFFGQKPLCCSAILW